MTSSKVAPFLRGAVIVAFVVLAVCVCFTSAGCQSRSKTVRVGVRTDVPGMASMDTQTGEFSGYEVDLANELFHRIYGNDVNVVFIGVSADTRESMLDAGSIDALIACYTITDSRQEMFNLSQPYYTASTKIMVNRSSGYTNISDLDGRTIGVMVNSTSATALQEYAQSKGVTVFPNEYESYLQIKDSLSNDLIAGFCSDDVVLAGYLDDDTILLPDSFVQQDYGIATRKDDTALAASIDETLAEMDSDGTIASLEEKWAVTPA